MAWPLAKSFMSGLHKKAPLVLAMQSTLGLDVDLVIGKLFRFWNHCAQAAEDGLIRSADAAAIDALMNCQGFGEALVQEKWLTFTDQGAAITPFAMKAASKETKVVGKDRRRFLDKTRRAVSRKLAREGRGEVVKVKAPSKPRPEKKSRKPETPPPETPALPVQAETNEPKPETNNDRPRSAIMARFDKFWAIYPNKKKKFIAARAWQKLKVDDELLEQILTAVRAQCRWPEWTKEGGRFVPHPSTWLNGGHWLDQPTVIPTTGALTDEERRARIALERKQAREAEEQRTKKSLFEETAPPPPADDPDDEPVGEDISGFYEAYIDSDSDFTE